jgi:hypothetical protein
LSNYPGVKNLCSLPNISWSAYYFGPSVLSSKQFGIENQVFLNVLLISWSLSNTYLCPHVASTGHKSLLRFDIVWSCLLFEEERLRCLTATNGRGDSVGNFPIL